MPVTARSTCPVHDDDTDALTRFVAHALAMLDPATPEERRRQLEPELLAQLPILRAMGVFDLFSIRSPALQRLIEDEMAALEVPTR